MQFRLIRHVAPLVGSLLISMNGVAAEPAPPHSPNAALDVYAKPGRLVDIGGGRKLNLRCAGLFSQPRFFFLMRRRPPTPTPFPSTPLSRSPARWRPADFDEWRCRR